MIKKAQDYREYVQQAAPLMGLQITPESFPGVVDNFNRLAEISALVTEFELTKDIEIAATFKPQNSQ